MATAVASFKISMDPYFKILMKGIPFKGNEEMKYEGIRLKAFKDWPNWAAVWPTLLARAGFYYTGTADQVVCFCCNGRLKTWEAGDSPLSEHKRFFPQCRFVTGRDSTNVPMGETPEGPTSLDHSTPAVNGRLPQRGQCASLQYSATTEAPSSSPPAGLSMAIGGTTGILSLSLQQLQDMKLESKRLESFTNWPTIAYVRPENLAKAGVYYLGLADRVKCAFCNGILRNWVPGNDPMEVHQKYFPKCAFIKDPRVAGNVSIEEEKLNIQQALQNAVANPSPSSQTGLVPEVANSLNYSGETSRLLSFRQWPQNSKQSADYLALAGFYYTGIEDSVKCFSCNVTLRSWERGDDPWTEHARWSPQCDYVKTVKGEAFICNVQAAFSGQTNAATVSHSTGPRKFPVEARAIRARMDTSRVRSVLDMGFSRDLVYKVIEQRLTTTGDDFPNVQCLLEAVFCAEEAEPNSSSAQTRHVRSTTTTSRAPEPPARGHNGAAASAAATENQAAPSAHTSCKEMKSEVKPATSEDQRLVCKICMDDEAKIVFLPCGHLCCCARCAPALRNCPICRALIRGTVRIFLS